MAKLKNNEGTVARPIGKPRADYGVVPDAILFDASISASARLVLAYIAGRPDGWIVIVSDVCLKLGFSDSQWKTARDNLRAAGIIPKHHPIRFGGGNQKFTWVLDIHLEKYYLTDTPKLSTGHQSKIADGSHQRFSHDGKTAGKQQEVLNQSTTTAEKNDVDVDIEEKKKRDKLLSASVPSSVVFTIAKILQTEIQSDQFCRTFSDAVRLGKIKSLHGFATSHARKVAAGLVEDDQNVDVDLPVNPTLICANNSDRRGSIIGLNGVLAVALSGHVGQLRRPVSAGNELLTLTVSAALWQKVEAGELDFRTSK